jgi:hypothetical protein
VGGQPKRPGGANGANNGKGKGGAGRATPSKGQGNGPRPSPTGSTGSARPGESVRKGVTTKAPADVVAVVVVDDDRPATDPAAGTEAPAVVRAELHPENRRVDRRSGTERTTSRTPVVVPTIVPAEPISPPAPALAPSTPATVVVPLPHGVPAEHTDTDGTDGLPSLLRPKRPQRALRAPVVRPRRAPRVRRVTRVVRHVDSWSIFKVALVFNLFLYGVCLTSGVLLWQVAQNTGTIDNVERFFESFGWESFQFKGGELYHNAWIAGLFVVVGLTGLAVLMATLFNLITDLVGGIRVTVLEEEVVAREDRGLGWRRGSRSRGAPPVATGLPAVEPAVDQPQPG